MGHNRRHKIKDVEPRTLISFKGVELEYLGVMYCGGRVTRYVVRYIGSEDDSRLSWIDDGNEQVEVK